MKKEIIGGIITTVVGGLLLFFLQNIIFNDDNQASENPTSVVADCEKVVIKGADRIEKLVLRQVADYYDKPANDFCYDSVLKNEEDIKYKIDGKEIDVKNEDKETWLKSLYAPKFEQDIEAILDIKLCIDYPITLKEFIDEVKSGGCMFEDLEF